MFSELTAFVCAIAMNWSVIATGTAGWSSAGSSVPDETRTVEEWGPESPTAALQHIAEQPATCVPVPDLGCLHEPVGEAGPVPANDVVDLTIARPVLASGPEQGKEDVVGRPTSHRSMRPLLGVREKRYVAGMDAGASSTMCLPAHLPSEGREERRGSRRSPGNRRRRHVAASETRRALRPEVDGTIGECVRGGDSPDGCSDDQIDDFGDRSASCVIESGRGSCLDDAADATSVDR